MKTKFFLATFMAMSFASATYASETSLPKRPVRIIDMSVNSPSKVLDVNKALPTLVATSTEDQKSLSHNQPQ